MRYDIRLTLGCSYGAPSDHARMVARILPSSIPGRQTVVSRLLGVLPRPSECRETTDFFGNAMTVMAFHAPIEQVELTLTAQVEQLPPRPGLDLSPDLPGLAAEIGAQRSLGPTSPLHHVGPSTRIMADPAIAAFARDMARPGMTALQVVTAVGEALHAHMRFDTGATDVDTPPSEAFANRHGVCQDFSQVMIAALRSLGIPAGYVSGFLRTVPPEGQPRLEGADAMHAWVSAWCGTELGWIEYDPTNACLVGADHVVVARGRDYSDASPIKGALRTSGGQHCHHEVDVIPL